MVIPAKQYGYGTIKVKKNDWDVRTRCICFGFGTSRVSKEVHKLLSNQNAVLGEHLGIEPHETRRTHVLEEGQLIIVGHIFPNGIVLAVRAKEMGEVTLCLCQKKSKQMLAPSLRVLFRARLSRPELLS